MNIFTFNNNNLQQTSPIFASGECPIHLMGLSGILTNAAIFFKPMIPPTKKKSLVELHWLLNVDLTDYGKFSQLRFRDAASDYWNDEPWCSIVAPNRRTQAILIYLQNELRGQAMKLSAIELARLRTQANIDRAEVSKLKIELENEILQGASISDYERCWRAWRRGDEPESQFAMAVIERKRRAWRLKREREREEAKLSWQVVKRAGIKGSSEVLRNRAPGITVDVNWFEPMPIYNHKAHNETAPWGYCHATGQNRKTLTEFLSYRQQKPKQKAAHKGAGKPLSLYGFKTNLLVLNKWLGDWLVNSPDKSWQYQDTDKPGETFLIPVPERVCTSIDRLLYHASIYEHTDEQAEQFCAVLQKHWRRWWNKVKDVKLRAELVRSNVDQTLSFEVGEWREFCSGNRERLNNISSKTHAGYFLKNGHWVKPRRNGVMPYAEVETAFRLFQGMPV